MIDRKEREELIAYLEGCALKGGGGGLPGDLVEQLLGALKDSAGNAEVVGMAQNRAGEIDIGRFHDDGRQIVGAQTLLNKLPRGILHKLRPQRLGLEVDYPEGQTCCGQPPFNSGFWGDAREVAAGFECGIGLSDFQDLHPGDIIETFEEREIART